MLKQNCTPMTFIKTAEEKSQTGLEWFEDK